MKQNQRKSKAKQTERRASMYRINSPGAQGCSGLKILLQLEEKKNRLEKTEITNDKMRATIY